MDSTKHTIQAHFNSDDQARSEILERIRQCSALSKPWIMPPSGHSKTEKLPEPFQSMLSRGLTNIIGKMLLAMWPPGIPFFQLLPAAEIRFDPAVSPQRLQRFSQVLFLHELTIVSLLESASLIRKAIRRVSGFRTAKHKTLNQIMVTGETLEQLTDDYRLKVFRRDKYVSKRDSSGDVLYHIVKESIDPLTLTEDQREKAQIPPEKLDKPVADRMHDIYTRVEWQPVARVWLIEQEINKHVINRSQDPVNPFFCTPFELAPDEDYGRGWVELNLGDARSYDELREKILDFAAMASKMHPVIDDSSLLREEDLDTPSGTPLRAKVIGGQVQDVAYLRLDKLSDFSVVQATSQAIRDDLAAALLLESELTPRGDRVTALQVQRIAAEVDAATGGFYAPIADDQQLQLLHRVMWQARRDRVLPTLPDNSIEIRALTGVAALGRELDKQRMLGLVQAYSQLGPQAMARIDMGIFIDALARYSGFYEPGFIKSEEQLQREAQQAIALQAQAAGAEKLIDVAGNVAEATLSPQNT
jgi:hypothetical protein